MKVKHKQSVIQMDFIQKKYVRFDRFPWKFILHLLLIALCTYQALRIVSIQDKHTRIQQQVFSTIYLQDDDGSSSFPYYSLADFSDAFFSIVNNTESLDQTLLQYSLIDNVEYSLQVYYSQVTLDNQDKMSVNGTSSNWLNNLDSILNINPDDLQGFKKFLQNVENMQLQISNLVTYISQVTPGEYSDCLNWTINIGYSLQSLANVQSTLEAISNQCHNIDSSFETQNLLGIHLAIIITASLSLFLSWRQVYQVSKEYLYYKRKTGVSQSQDIGQSRFKGHSNWDKNWQDLDFLDKLKFFDFWFLVIAAGNFFQVFGALVALLQMVVDQNLAIFEHKQFLIGFGVMLAWVTILKYLQYSPNLNLMSATLAKSWSNLLVFLLGVMPFFLGFVFLGQTIFWKYNKFQDTSSSVITLFSLLNGDIVNDTFLQTWAQGLPGQLYLIVFMILFYTAVQNVFVTIIMQGYEQSIKERQQKKLLQNKQAQDRQLFQKHLQQVQLEQEQMVPSPQMTPQQLTGAAKIKKNGKKVQMILDQLSKIFNEVNQSELTGNQKQYLQSLLKDNLSAIGSNIKLQLRQIQK